MQTPTRAIGFGRLSSFGRQVLASAALAATPLTASIAAEDGPPTLNVGPSCEAVARYSIVAGRDKGSCMADERGSQDQISKNWPKYAPADKTLCVGMNRTGGAASYVELLSCLEVMRDAKEIHNELADPFLKKGAEFDSRKLMPTDVDEGLVGGSSTAHRGHKPKKPQTGNQ